ncbi:MAG: hypothetical protein JWP12_1836 [Bacteroidetes bacterium]|nr:hypothetical protein [Bacteroidota bacterium]
MAGIAYNKLFSTQIVHDFYADNLSKRDLAVVPTTSTNLAMKNNNMLFRNDASGFRVLYKADSAGAAFVNFSNVRLVFAVQLLNLTQFLNFTNLGDGVLNYTAGKILYFTNRGSVTTSNLTYSLLDFLRPATFTYQFPQTTGTVGYIKITNDANVDVTPVTPDPNTILPDASNRFFYPVDLSKLPKGLYKFETGTDLASSVTKTVYIDNELASQGVFGIVDILAVNALAVNYPVDRMYTMKFIRRATQWKYILLLKSPGVTPPPLTSITLDIEDTVAPVTPYVTIHFNPAVDGTVNGIPAKIITSVSTTIPFFEVPKMGLTVKKDPGPSAITIMENLPGPPLGVVSAQTSPTVNAGITEIFVII